MSRSLERLKSEALELPIDARAELATILIDSLDEGADAAVEAAWDDELERRMDAIDRGDAAGEPAATGCSHDFAGRFWPKPAIFHSAATAELDEAVGFYERRRPGLGTELLSAGGSNSSLRIEQNPALGARYKRSKLSAPLWFLVSHFVRSSSYSERGRGDLDHARRARLTAAGLLGAAQDPDEQRNGVLYSSRFHAIKRKGGDRADAGRLGSQRNAGR